MSVTAPPAPSSSGRRTGRWIDDWRPGRRVLGERGRPRRPSQPDLVDLRRAPGLLGVVVLERQRRAAGPFGYDFSVGQLFLLVAIPNLVGSAAPALHVRGAEVRRSELDGDQRAAAARSDPAVRRRGAEPPDAVLGLRPHLRHGRRRRRQLRLEHGEHQLLLPREAQGTGARPQRGGRQHRRGRAPARAPGRGRRRRPVRPGRRQQRWDPPGTRRLPVRRARGPRGGHGLLLHGQPVLGPVVGQGHRRGAQAQARHG